MEVVFKQVSDAYIEQAAVLPALTSIDAAFASGQWHCLIGAAGSGKSTLLQLAAGLRLPRQGQIQAGTVTLEPTSKKALRREAIKQSGLVYQFAEQQFFEESVERELLFGLLNQGMNEITAKERASQMAMTVGLKEELLQRSPFSLSGGEQRKVALASILAMRPSLLLLDEPTAGLDPVAAEQILEVLRQYQATTQCTVLHSSHDMGDVYHCADHVVWLEAGKVQASGTANEIFVHHMGGMDNALLPPPLSIARQIGVKLTADMPKVTMHTLLQSVRERQLEVGERH
ncbi:ATP-binding cassette domain-containing protein [Aureibacillus halotolerans]|uniref:Energy-coupling factor transport system ATP-binding protein n=1 Tax=Aureibacillus halotolerans TaxID=1508390 RepID=A0A4R6TQE4_9BACI|nr:ATP-binding cassette domain-containing protein [Aureibacillus halotolerans]TDQ34739.1 energy-coupling factor transport system ATP-binding protein [Aureibacillus halotolerans]